MQDFLAINKGNSCTRFRAKTKTEIFLNAKEEMD